MMNVARGFLIGFSVTFDGLTISVQKYPATYPSIGAHWTALLSLPPVVNVGE